MRAHAGSALLSLFLMLISSPLFAVWPDSGWYWNPGEPGRGLSIEVQDDKLFVAIYTYEASGAPVYYYAAGRMSGDRNFSETLYRTANGQCVGCGYRAPGVVAVGGISINFTSHETATVVALGTTLSVQRFDFSETNLYNPAALYGEWATTEGDPRIPSYFGDRLIFNAPYTSAGKNYAQGYRTGNTSRVTLGRCENRGLCVVAFSFSSSSDEYYTFSMAGFNRMEGLMQIIPAGGSPTAGAGFYFVAHRTKTRALVQTGSGPGISKAAGPSDDTGFLDALALEKAAYASRAPKSSVAPSFDSLVVERLLGEVASDLARAKAAHGRP